MKKYCKICGTYLGDTKTCIDAQGCEIDYFSIISRKYCPSCGAWAREQNNRVYLHNFRQRQKQLRQAEKNRLQLLEEENELLRRQIMKLRSEIEKT